MANFYDQFRVERNTRGVHFINLGDWHGYEAGLDNAPGSNRTTLQVGCRTFLNAAAARLHWRGGVTRDGGAPRPFAEALISLAEALCRINGWPNWAGPLLLPTDHEQLHHALAQRDRTIQDLSGKLDVERQHIASRDNTVEMQARTIRELNATIVTLRAQAGHLNKDHGPVEVATPAIYSPEQQALQRQLNELRTRVAELEKHLQPTIKAG